MTLSALRTKDTRSAPLAEWPYRLRYATDLTGYEGSWILHMAEGPDRPPMLLVNAMQLAQEGGTGSPAPR